MFGQEPEEFRGAAQDIPNPEAVLLTPVDLQTFSAEYVVRVPDVVIHVNRKDDMYWKTSDAQHLWDAMCEVFRFQDREDRLRVEFIPEAYGWCVTLFRVATIMPPTKEMILRALTLFEELRGPVDAVQE